MIYCELFITYTRRFEMKMRLLKTILVSVIAFGILFTQSGTNVNAQENEGKCKIIFDGNGGKLYGYDYISVDGSGTKSTIHFDGRIEFDCTVNIKPNTGYPDYGQKNGQALDYFFIDGTDTHYYIKGATGVPEGALYIDDYVPNGDVTFKAHYTDAYKVTFKSNGGEVGNKILDYVDGNLEIYVAKGAKIFNIGNDAQGYREDGYILEGYKTENDDNIYQVHPSAKPNIRDYVVNKDTVFAAQWKAYTPIKVVFKLNGGYYQIKGSSNKVREDYDIITVKGHNLNGEFDDIEIMKNDDPNKEFAGWKSSIDGKTYSYEEVKKLPYIISVEGSVDFTAQWKEKKDDSKKDDDSGKNDKKPKYSNEWVDGKWYDADGTQTYKGTLAWKNDATGWWIDDGTGWYPTNNWQKIDGVWYFFKPDGYMAANEYYNGYWFNKDGSWDEQYFLSWKQNSTGWWVEDKSGWWPASSWLKIDGYWYYFDASGYMVTNQYVDGWWISSDGVCY